MSPPVGPLIQMERIVKPLGAVEALQGVNPDHRKRKVLDLVGIPVIEMEGRGSRRLKALS